LIKFKEECISSDLPEDVRQWRHKRAGGHFCTECGKAIVSIYTICKECWDKDVKVGIAHPQEWGAC